MAVFVSEAHRLWNSKRPARLAGVLLLLVWVGPVTFDQTDAWQLLRLVGAPGRAVAESQVIPAGMGMVLQPMTLLELRLRDGSILEGRFLRRTLLDSAVYARRFAEKAGSSSYVPFALGETLRVSLRDGREWTAPFAGYRELTLLLQSPDGPEPWRVPFEFASEIHRANGDRVEPRDLAQAFRAGLLPSAEALELQQRLPPSGMGHPWGATFRVAVEDIVSVTTTCLSPGSSVTPSGNANGFIALGVFVTVVVIFVMMNKRSKKSSPSCSPDYKPGGFFGAQLTTRPFDRSRGCYVGDPLVVADPGFSTIGEKESRLVAVEDLP